MQLRGRPLGELRLDAGTQSCMCRASGDVGATSSASRERCHRLRQQSSRACKDQHRGA